MSVWEYDPIEESDMILFMRDADMGEAVFPKMSRH